MTQMAQQVLNDRASARPDAVSRVAADKAIRVLYVIDRLDSQPYGGAERALWNMLECISKDKFHCSLVTFAPEGESGPEKYAGYPVRVLRMRSCFDSTGMKAARELFRLVRKERFDVVHTFFETSDLFAGPIARLAGCPVWVSSRRDMGILRSRFHHKAYPVMTRGMSAVFAVSEEVRRYTISTDGIKPAKVQTIYTGIERPTVDTAECEKLRASLGISKTAPIISTLANIRPVKGLDVLVDAAGQVCREVPDAAFLVGGLILDRECHAALEKQVAALGLQRNVRFLGRVSAGTLLGISDIFCLLSRSEGFSNAIVEAMSCSLPVVATRVGGNAEAIVEDKTGFVGESGDSKSAAVSLLRLLADSKLRREMGAAGSQRFLDVFTREAMTREITLSYERLLSARGKHPGGNQWRN
jgi:glycosyltransferase involved in cell wall biosynthesis